MNWDALGAIGENIGAIAVVLTLVYLSIQVKENTLVSKSEAFRDGASIWNDVFKMFLDADSKTIMKALQDYNALASHEKHQFDVLMIALTSALESNLEATQGELLDTTVDLGVEGFFRRYFAYEGAIQWWQQGKIACGPGVVEWIEARFSAPDLEFDYWGLRNLNANT